MIEVSIVIPNYNGEKVLGQNLPAVLEAGQDHQAEVVVVDDASTDQSVKLLREKFPQVEVVERKKNQGFASTVNTGVTRARGKVVVLLNTDVRPEPDFLKFLLPHFQDESVFAVGCLEKDVAGNQLIWRGRGAAKFRRGFLVHRWADPEKGRQTLWVSGGSGAFSRAKWQKLGGMRTIYDPFYYEDLDLSWRAQKMGWRVLVEPKARVSHEHQKGAIKGSYPAARIKQIAYRNQFFFVWLNITSRRWLAEHFIWLPVHLAQAVISRDWPFILGLIEALAKLSLVPRERKKLTKSVITDQQILATGG